jgi:tetratricopeptide (TPR) repeat protein
MVLSAFAAAAFAQTAPVSGEVKIKKADGTIVPAAGITVDAYRIDIDKGKMPSAKTNKKGQFNFVGFILGQTYAIVVSGPGISPDLRANIKAGSDNINFEVSEGDGKTWTEEEVRTAIKSQGGGGGAASGGGGQNTQVSAEQKKQREDLEKKNAEIKAKNEKMQSDDAVASKAFQDGRAALDAKNYDLAVTKFDEGIAAVPDFVGSTPFLLSGKSVALKARGYAYYLQGAGQTDAQVRIEKFGLAKKEFSDSLAAFAQGVDIVKKAPAATDPKEQASRKTVLTELYTTAIEVHRLMAAAAVDTTRTAEAETIINDYIAIETDPAKQVKARKTLADIMRSAGVFDKAIATYRTVLEATPDDTEVMASIGLSLVAQGTSVDPPNREQLQEGLNYMQKYADTVQILPTDPKPTQEFKQSVKDTVEYLKTEQKLKAQPTKAAPAKKKTT